LPAIPTAIVLPLQQAIEPASLIAIVFVAAIGFLVYVIGHLSLSASEVERLSCRSLKLNTIRFAQACFKRTKDDTG
jgi:hypothetical protein